ncbi:class I SAM-dependent methyltransferase [Xanthomonas sp. NCPPB 2632]|uniref:class I SAM-dependent methyltransferase n=1 Tax=Xanthomonas sp. NCPPB 2632 TaxID=3240912 RepID=UPI003516F317
MSSKETLGAALQALALGRHTDASTLLKAAHGLRMAHALLALIGSDAPTGAYDHAKAFEAFIRSGGNVALYKAVSCFLAGAYDRHGPVSLLDIGVGDGLALIPALAQTTNALKVIDVVEPNADLLRSLSQRLELHATHAVGFEAFAEDLSDDDRWDMAQSTFALQSVSPDVRKDALRRLATHVDVLVVVEFDLPVHEARSEELYRSLARRYEQAAQECGEDAALVAAGFLGPMLLGQLSASTPSNWEQTAGAWVDELTSCGFTDIVVEHIHDYSWAPAVGITARAVNASVSLPSTADATTHRPTRHP